MKDKKVLLLLGNISEWIIFENSFSKNNYKIINFLSSFSKNSKKSIFVERKIQGSCFKFSCLASF